MRSTDIMYMVMHVCRLGNPRFSPRKKPGKELYSPKNTQRRVHTCKGSAAVLSLLMSLSPLNFR